MTVRPVDLQVVVQKSAELMKSRQEEQPGQGCSFSSRQLQQKEKVENRQVKNLKKSKRKQCKAVRKGRQEAKQGAGRPGGKNKK